VEHGAEGGERRAKSQRSKGEKGRMGERLRGEEVMERGRDREMV